MNYRMVFRMLGTVLLCLAGLMLLPIITAVCFGESFTAFLIAAVVTAAAGGLLFMAKPKTTRIFAREGFAIVSLSWIFMSLLGALPFVISGEIPDFIDAFFETVSGFTTTGATILDDVESLSHACAFWRIFSHWIGGMGVLVFVMAILPLSGEHSMHIMRAEVPGPVVGKLVPRARKTAITLYLIYVALTALETIMLKLGGMSFYEALLHSFSTAGTGGFSTRAASITGFDSVYIEMVIAVFMLLFSLNFSIYFLALTGHALEAAKNEELHWFLGLVAAAVVFIALSIKHIYGSLGTAFRHSFFNVLTIISTTGFGTVDFNLWPEYVKWVLLGLMVIGGCAGSTAGGMKLSRIMILIKSAFIDIRRVIHPRSVDIVRIDKKQINRETIDATKTYLILYAFALVVCAALISFDGNGVTTDLTASLACISNVGPGLDKVSPSGNYAFFSGFSKLVLAFEMLMGRLEIYPMLIIFSPSLWKSEKKMRKR